MSVRPAKAQCAKNILIVRCSNTKDTGHLFHRGRLCPNVVAVAAID